MIIHGLYQKKNQQLAGVNLGRIFFLCEYFFHLPQRNNVTWARDLIGKPVTGQGST